MLQSRPIANMSFVVAELVSGGFKKILVFLVHSIPAPPLPILTCASFLCSLLRRNLVILMLDNRQSQSPTLCLGLTNQRQGFTFMPLGPRSGPEFSLRLRLHARCTRNARTACFNVLSTRRHFSFTKFSGSVLLIETQQRSHLTFGHPGHVMPPRKRVAPDATEANGEPVPKRRSSRQAASAASIKSPRPAISDEPQGPPQNKRSKASHAKAVSSKKSINQEIKDSKPASKKVTKPSNDTPKASKKAATTPNKKDSEHKESTRDASEDPDVDAIPTTNPEAPRHEDEWYWLMKAEPETRFENGIDVRFSIDDLRAKIKPEGWDGTILFAITAIGMLANGCVIGIRAYAGMCHWHTWMTTRQLT